MRSRARAASSLAEASLSPRRRRFAVTSLWLDHFSGEIELKENSVGFELTLLLAASSSFLELQILKLVK